MMPGLVNLDFADVKTTMSKAGLAIMGIGVASGENRAIEAAEQAISHPLLEDVSISGAKGVLMNITSNSDLTMEEMSEASERIYKEVGEDADIIWGAVVDDTLGDEMSVTVIATGIGLESESVFPDHHGGKIRDITHAELQNAIDYDEPTFIRQQEAVGELRGATYRGYKGIVIDNTDLSDLDVPTFLRKKAD
jgi:cell division protein FtsZ